MARGDDELRVAVVNGGVPRHQVLDVLLVPRFVRQAVAVGRCFHCRAPETDVTGLCLLCRTYLNDEERRAAQAYYDSY